MFLPTPDAVAAVRQLVADTLRARHATDAIEDALLVSSELASNAVQHAGTPFRVSVEIEPAWVRISVADADRMRPEVAARGRHAASGRGLPIIDHLSASWGTRPLPAGKVVWSVIERRPA